MKNLVQYNFGNFGLGIKFFYNFSLSCFDLKRTFCLCFLAFALAVIAIRTVYQTHQPTACIKTTLHLQDKDKHGYILEQSWEWQDS